MLEAILDFQHILETIRCFGTGLPFHALHLCDNSSFIGGIFFLGIGIILMIWNTHFSLLFQNVSAGIVWSSLLHPDLFLPYHLYIFCIVGWSV